MRVLIIRYSAIGDCVMAAWPVTALRREYPQAEIDWAVESRCAPVIAQGALATGIIGVPRKDAAGRKQKGLLLPTLRIYAGMRARQYDVAIDLQGQAKTNLALKLARPRRRLGRVLDPSSQEHECEVEAHLLATAFENPHLSRLSELPIMPPAPPRQSRLVTMSVSAGHADKAIPTAIQAEVARQLAAEGWNIEFLGGPLDKAPAEIPGVRNRVGELSLGETLSRISESALHIAGDTGSGHMAAAYGTPAVAVFGPTDPARFRPYSATTEVLRNGNSTENVSAEEILAAAHRRLDGEPTQAVVTAGATHCGS